MIRHLSNASVSCVKSISSFFNVRFAVTLGMCFLGSAIKAETGCLVGSSIYTTEFTTGGTSYNPRKFDRDGIPIVLWPVTGSDPPLLQCANFYKSTPVSTGVVCGIYPNRNANVNSSTQGVMVIYQTYCPIDDYIPIMLVAIGVLGFCVIRNRFAYFL